MKLTDYLKKHKISVADFAKSVGVDQDSVYRYCNGTRRPSWRVLPKIMSVTGGKVKAESFLPRPSRAA
jgi:transcriptional regulator with XRE-family HTH domain